MGQRIILKETDKKRIRRLYLMETTKAPSISGKKWDIIFKLFSNDPGLKDTLMKNIQEGIDSALPYSPGKQWETFELCEDNWVDLCPDPTVSFDAEITEVTLKDITRWKNGVWNVVSGTFKGNIDLGVKIAGIGGEAFSTELYGNVDIWFKVENGEVIYELKNLNASASSHLSAIFAKLYFTDNHVKLWINTIFWSGYVGSWNTGIEDEVASAVDNQEPYDLKPWLIENGYYTPED